MAKNKNNINWLSDEYPDDFEKINWLEDEYQDGRNQGFLEQAGQFAEQYINKPVEKYLQPAITGAIEGGPNALINLLSLPGEAMGSDPLPHIDVLSQNLLKDEYSPAARSAGEMIGELPVFGAGYGMLSKGAAQPATKLGRGAQEMLKGGMLGYGLSPSDDSYGRELGAAFGAAVPAGASAGSEAIDFFKRAFKGGKSKPRFEQLSKDIEATKESKLESEEKKRDLQEALAREVSSLDQGRATKVKEGELEAESMFPDTSAAAKKDLSEGLSNFHTNVRENLGGRYQKLENSPSGQQKINEPLSLKDVEQGKYSKDTQRLIDKHIGFKKTEKGSTSVITGTKPDREVVINANPSIGDYISMRRQLNDEAIKLSKASTNPNFTPEQKKKFGSQAKQLNRLQSKIDEKLQKNMSPSDWAELQDINQQWSDFVIPFRTDPTLKKSVKGEGKITSENLYKYLDKGFDKLRNKMFEHDPELSRLMAQHDFMNIDLSNPNSIKKVLESDQGRSMPKDMRDRLQSLLNDQELAKEANYLSKQIQGGEIKQIQNAPHITKAIKNNRKLNEPWQHLVNEEKNIKDMQSQLKRMGLEKDKIAQEIKAYEDFVKGLKNIAKYGAVGAAGTVGYSYLGN